MRTLDNKVRLEFGALREEIILTKRIPHGKGTREAVMGLPVETLFELASVLGQFPREDWGHGFYHWSKQKPTPCAACPPGVVACSAPEEAGA